MLKDVQSQETSEHNTVPHCLVCGTTLSLRPAQGRKSLKPFIMMICPINGRHIRGFITDQEFVNKIMDRLHKYQ